MKDLNETAALGISKCASSAFAYLDTQGVRIALLSSQDPVVYARLKRECLLYQMVQTALLNQDFKRATRLLLLLRGSSSQTSRMADECLGAIRKRMETV